MEVVEEEVEGKWVLLKMVISCGKGRREEGCDEGGCNEGDCDGPDSLCCGGRVTGFVCGSSLLGGGGGRP